MAIDWFTIGAQILNFLVLVYLLKRFLYRPVLDAIASREKRIAKTLAEAASMKADAATEREGLQAKNDAFDKDRAALLAKATQAADTERKTMIDAARTAADALGEKQKRSLARDAKSLGDEIGRGVTAEVFAITRKVLADMADAGLEERMSALFIRKVGALGGTDKTALAAMLASATGRATVRSAFDLPTGLQEAIEKAINDEASTKTELIFETAPDLVSGIELVGGGEKLAWSLSDYLQTLEKSVSEALASKAPAMAGAP